MRCTPHPYILRRQPNRTIMASESKVLDMQICKKKTWCKTETFIVQTLNIWESITTSRYICTWLKDELFNIGISRSRASKNVSNISIICYWYPTYDIIYIVHRYIELGDEYHSMSKLFEQIFLLILKSLKIIRKKRF